VSLTTLNAFQQGGPVLDKLKQLWEGIRGKADDPSLGYIGASMLPGIGEATYLVEIGAGLQDRSLGRVGLGLAGLMLPFVGAAGVRKLLKGRRKLPMDEASRLKRAEEMGFDMDLELAHGTNRPVKGADDWTALEPSSVGDFGPGIYLSSPGFAEKYASSGLFNRLGGSPRLYPARVRSKKLLKHDSDEWKELVDKAYATPRPPLDRPARSFATISGIQDDDVLEILVDLAKEAGYEGMYRGTLRSGSSWGGAPVVSIFDSKNIRSPWAAFDPAKAGSRNLLAGIGGLTGARYMSNALREDREN
jgi:hypothetical protein